jgi:hypothetical protein
MAVRKLDSSAHAGRFALTTYLHRSLAWILACLLLWPAPASAYSVLTHETIIDSAWEVNIKPLLLKRFPDASAEDLHKAHAYAYGGAIIQDLGYYPHGSKFFSDLTHYVRSGDFVLSLLRNSKDLNDYAFAIGSMAHYAADNAGHRLGTNLAVPILYPKLKIRYGKSVTYEDDPLAHTKTEFAFDVLEVAKGRYAPESYHDFIGFEVAESLLSQAFQETYGMDIKLVLTNEGALLNSYRRDVSKLIPKATRVAWHLKKNEIKRDIPGITRKKFLYNLSRASYEKEWGKQYDKPTFSDKFYAFLFRILPKIGPLRALTFRTPTPQTEKLFQESFNVTLERYRSLLGQLGKGSVALPNDNFDVGESTARGIYQLSDNTYVLLLDDLAKQNFVGVTPELRSEILKYFANPPAQPRKPTKHKQMDEKVRARIEQNLEKLKNLSVEPTASPNPSPTTLMGELAN